MTATEDVKALRDALMQARRNMEHTLRDLRRGRSDNAQVLLVDGVRQVKDALQDQARRSVPRRGTTRPAPP